MINPNEESEWKKNEKKEFDAEWETVLSREPAELNEYHKDFLVARRHMLTKDQQEKYGKVIEAKMKANLSKDAEVDEDEETPAKKK